MDLSSVYAPAVREALIKMEDERVTHQHLVMSLRKQSTPPLMWN